VHKRLSVLARAHGALQEASGQDAPVRNYLRALLEPLATEEISVRVAAPNVRWPVAILAPLGLLASEAVINALKHGYPDDRRGAIRVELAQSEDGSAQLTIADDGVGCATAPDEHLGMRLVRALARRLEGRLELRSPPEAGFTVLLGFPLEAASAAGVAPGR
jgi:two-component sensor histidine kinase